MKVWPARDDLRLGAYAKGVTGLLMLIGGLALGADVRWIAAGGVVLLAVAPLRMWWTRRVLARDILAPAELVVRSRRDVLTRRVPLAVFEIAVGGLFVVVAPEFPALFGLVGVLSAATDLVEARVVQGWERAHGGRLVRFGAGFAVV
jgi:hypothetical protein